MMYVPEFVALYEIFPYIEYLPLNNETIRVSVKDYRKCGEKRDAIINKYGKIEDWNTTDVTAMNRLFYENRDFNEDISKWDTSNVKNMSFMFEDANNFNQPIGKWNVSKVTKMEHMFSNAESFNQDIRDWDTSKVTNAWLMLHGATSFNVKNVSCSLLKIILGIHYESDSDSDDYDSDDE